MICEDPVLESIILYSLLSPMTTSRRICFTSVLLFAFCFALPAWYHDSFGRLLIFSNLNRGHHITKPLTKEGSQQNSADWMSNLPFSHSLTLQLFIDLHVFTCQDLKSISWIHFRIIGVKKSMSRLSWALQPPRSRDVKLDWAKHIVAAATTQHCILLWACLNGLS